MSISEELLADLMLGPEEVFDRDYGDMLTKFEKSGRLGRWLIGKRFPRVQERYEYMQAQAGISEARRRSAALADELVIPG